jgi:hypothetical protein
MNPRLPVLFALAVAACSGSLRSRTPDPGTPPGPGTGAESTPEVEYVGPNNPNPPANPDAPAELLFTTPSRPYGDLGTIRVTCTGGGCAYGAASAAMIQKARQIGASGVHSIQEVSGNVNQPMDAVSRQNARVFNLAGTAFVYAN